MNQKANSPRQGIQAKNSKSTLKPNATWKLLHCPTTVLLTYLLWFGLALGRYEIMLSTRPEKSVGTDEIWDLATEALKGALKRKGWDYKVQWVLYFLFSQC